MAGHVLRLLVATAPGEWLCRRCNTRVCTTGGPAEPRNYACGRDGSHAVKND